MTEQLIEWAEKRPGLIVRGTAESGAVFTDCEQYRPLLWRVWGDGPLIMWLCLNPSTADEIDLDPTLTRCRNFTQRWGGYGGMIVCNIFDFRATSPTVMKKQARPNSEHNSLAICRAAKLVKLIVCGWGNDGQHNDQARFIGAWLHHAGVADELAALRVTKRDQPGHPLYLPGRLTPRSFYLPGHV